MAPFIDWPGPALFVSMGDGDRHADCRTWTGFAFDRQICYATGDCEWSRVVTSGDPGNRGLPSGRRRPEGVTGATGLHAKRKPAEEA